MRRFGRPSPSMIVAIIALVFAMPGWAIAGSSVVRFAQNAGAVDGKSAVSAGSSLSDARGKLVATSKGNGQIPGKFIADVVQGNGSIGTFGIAQLVNDNQVGSAVNLITIPGYGTLSSRCADQQNQPNVENPTQTVIFSNASGGPVNYVRTVGDDPPIFTVPQNGTDSNTVINGSDSFEILLVKGSSSVTIEGFARQDGTGTANGSCVTGGQIIIDN